MCSQVFNIKSCAWYCFGQEQSGRDRLTDGYICFGLCGGESNRPWWRNCTAENKNRKDLKKMFIDFVIKNDVHLKFCSLSVLLNLQLLLIRLEQNPLWMYANNLENVLWLIHPQNLVNMTWFPGGLLKETCVSFSSSQKSDKVKLELSRFVYDATDTNVKRPMWTLALNTPSVFWLGFFPNKMHQI